jgi:hypothetical protein
VQIVERYPLQPFENAGLDLLQNRRQRRFERRIAPARASFFVVAFGAQRDANDFGGGLTAALAR